MATFQTYQSKGNREDLTDVITNIAPMDTWFTSTIGTTSVKGTYHEWQTDTLAAAAEDGVEGAVDRLTEGESDTLVRGLALIDEVVLRLPHAGHDVL